MERIFLSNLAPGSAGLPSKYIVPNFTISAFKQFLPLCDCPYVLDHPKSILIVSYANSSSLILRLAAVSNIGEEAQAGPAQAAKQAVQTTAAFSLYQPQTARWPQLKKQPGKPPLKKNETRTHGLISPSSEPT